MNFLDGPDPKARYRPLGYKRNPYPKQGMVEGEVYVARPELLDLENDLKAFLQGRPHGTVWAVQGAIGHGKSNFLKYVARSIDTALCEERLSATAYRFIPTAALTPLRVVQELLQGIGEESIVKLIERTPRAPVQDQLRATDFGRFWNHVGSTSAVTAAQFLMRWLGGQQTYKTEREAYGISARERLPPAIAFPYLRAMLEMFTQAGILKRIVLLLDEFEDIERLSKSTQTEYVQVLKTLLNAFNWQGLYVVIAGQAAAFTTIGENYPSLASRWRSVTLLPVQTPDDAVRLVAAYKQSGILPEKNDDRTLWPTEVDIKSEFIGLYEKLKPAPVTQRAILTSLHEELERRADHRATRT